MMTQDQEARDAKQDVHYLSALFVHGVKQEVTTKELQHELKNVPGGLGDRACQEVQPGPGRSDKTKQKSKMS
jgi:hypothetical protein